MDRLNIVGMVVSPSPAHSFGLDVIGHDVVVIREDLVADCTPPDLLDDFSVQQLPHLCWRPEFAVPLGWGILDAPNIKLKSAFFTHLLASAAEQRAVDRAEHEAANIEGWILGIK